MIRPIDANELLEHVYRDKLDSRELIERMVKNAPTIEIDVEKRRELQCCIDYLQHENERLKGEIKALVFAIRCNGVAGNEVNYENY